MILAVAIAVAAFHDGGDPVSLARSYRSGDVDVYRLQISPLGKTTPLSNPFEIRVAVEEGPMLVASGADTPYGDSRLLAKWQPLANGLVKQVVSANQTYSFLPSLFSTNDAALKPGEIEAVGSGSIKLVGVKDSVAQLKIWAPLGGDLVLSESSDVEVATRRLNHAQGTIYRNSGGRLVAVRSFVLERVRTVPVSPIPQDGGG